MIKRLIVALLVLWFIILVVPGLRERAEPRLTAASAWTWGMMERPLSPVTNRYRRVQAESHMSKASRQMTLTRNQGFPLPDQQGLAGFLARHDIVPDGLDPWGMPYLIQQEADSLALISTGPDLQYGTRDDLVVRIGVRRPGR